MKNYREYSLDVIRELISKTEIEISDLNKNVKLDKDGNMLPAVAILRAEKSDNLINLKLAQQRGNRKYSKLLKLIPFAERIQCYLDCYTNQYRIFKKSELERDRDFWVKKSKYSSSAEQIRKLDKEINKIKDKLTSFNLHCKVYVNIK
jgi:hypothetical protein